MGVLQPDCSYKNPVQEILCTDPEFFSIPLKYRLPCVGCRCRNGNTVVKAAEHLIQTAALSNQDSRFAYNKENAHITRYCDMISYMLHIAVVKLRLGGVYMATLLIVDDDRQTNEAICEYLKSAGHKIVPAYDGAEAVQIFHQESIDLVVLDIMLPKITGLAVLHEIRQKSSVPVLMLTAIEDEYTQVTSFDEQADDYITKPFSMVLVGRRITALLRRSGKNIVSDTMTFGDVVVDFSGYTAKDANGKIDITPKEISLLKLLVEHKGLVLTRSQILDDLWGIDNPIIDRTIDTYIKNLRKKLRLDCIVTVKGIGYKYEVSK